MASCLDWPSHWPLNDPTVVILDDTDWAEVSGWEGDLADPEWEAAEAVYGGAMLVHSNDYVSEGGGEILLVSDQ